MPITPKEMISLLKNHGFIILRQTGSHVFLENKYTQKRTTVPYHNKVLGKGLESKILKQAGLKNEMEESK